MTRNNTNELAAGRVSTPRSDWGIHLTFFLMCALPLALSFFMATDGTHNSLHLFGADISIRTVCMFHFVTGFACPTCGMTRSFISISHLHFREAFLFNRAGPFLYLLAVFEAPYRLALLLCGHIPLHRIFSSAEKILFVVFMAVDLFFFLWQFIRLI